MIFTDIARIRLASQQIAGTTLGVVKEVVAWMGAMQAQDYAMAKWAVGVRLPGSTDQVIEAAINAGEVIRTHLLRPTWHFVSADDVYWLLELTTPHIKASIKSRHKELELTEAIFAKSNSLIEKALRDGKQLTREQLIAEFAKADIATADNRLSHLMLQAELDGIVCSGASGWKTNLRPAGRKSSENETSGERRSVGKSGEKIFASHCLPRYRTLPGGRDYPLAMQKRPGNGEIGFHFRNHRLANVLVSRFLFHSPGRSKSAVFVARL
jgi:hypothetical protein